MKEVVTNISIGGSRIPHFSSLVVNQSMYHHHEFELTVDHDVTETLGFHTLDSSLKWVGESISIEADNFHFSGIVMSVDLVQSHNNHGNLVIRGYSPTILLETGEHLCSWNEKSLTDIVEEVAGRAGSLNATVKSEHSGSIDYMRQYGESNYDFLLRLAKQYNEWMYYNGSEFVFGKAKNGSTELVYGKDMDNMQLSVRMRPLKTKNLSYQSKQDKTIKGEGKNPLGELNEYAVEGKSASEKNFSFVPLQRTFARVKDKSEIDAYADKKMGAAAANLNWMSGTTLNTALSIGTTAKITAMLKNGTGFSQESYGEFMIYQVSHYFGPVGEYSNSFDALPAALNQLPEPAASFPNAETQIGIVIDNADPDNAGKVRVQLQWQEGSAMKTPWIRVMTPDAGKSDLHPKNRGQVFIPEIGDQVMIGFRYNDPNRPFVMGSMYHGVTGGGGKDQNHLKSIITRSGHVLEFNDMEGEESITITDKDKNFFEISTAGESITISDKKHNSMTIDTKSNSISIKAFESITLSAMNINLLAGMSVNVNAIAAYNLNTMNNTMNVAKSTILRTKDFTNTVTNNFSSTAKTINQTAQQDINTKAKKKITISAQDKLDQRAGKMDIATQKGKLRLNAKGNTEIKGKQVKTN